MRAVIGAVGLVALACGPSNPCSGHQFDRGQITFRAPRADTLAVSWFGQPEQAIVSGWPADLGPFAGVSLALSGRDSASGAILIDSKLGVQARPGMTARFVAGRAQRLSSHP